MFHLSESAGSNVSHTQQMCLRSICRRKHASVSCLQVGRSKDVRNTICQYYLGTAERHVMQRSKIYISVQKHLGASRNQIISASASSRKLPHWPNDQSFRLRMSRCPFKPSYPSGCPPQPWQLHLKPQQRQVTGLSMLCSSHPFYTWF